MSERTICMACVEGNVPHLHNILHAVRKRMCGILAGFTATEKRQDGWSGAIKRAADYFLPWTSSETVNFLRPLARRAANTRRPFAVCIRWRKPCLLFLFLLWGWNVLFIVFYAVLLFIFGIAISPQSTRAYGFSACKVRNYFCNSQNSLVIISKIAFWGVESWGR